MNSAKFLRTPFCIETSGVFTCKFISGINFSCSLRIYQTKIPRVLFKILVSSSEYFKEYQNVFGGKVGNYLKKYLCYRMFKEDASIRVFDALFFRIIFRHVITELYPVNTVNRWLFTFSMKATVPRFR